MVSEINNIFILMILLFLNHVHASPTLTLPRSGTPESDTLTAQKTGVECFSSKLRSRLADTRNCIQAALTLPDGADPGLFHSSNPADEYFLPRVSKFGNCMATVSLSGGSSDRSSWDHIQYVATQMAAICNNGQYPMGPTGGILRVGKYGKIRVTIEQALVGSGGISNDGGLLNLTATA